MKWLNAFPTESGISKTTSPSMIAKGKPNYDSNRERIVFGSHALVYTGTQRHEQKNHTTHSTKQIKQSWRILPHELTHWEDITQL